MKYLFSSLLLLAAANIHAQTALTSGQKLTETLKGTDKNSYTVAMQNGGYFSCTVMQLGTDLAIDLISPTGKAVKTFDSPNGDRGKELVMFDATEKGNYKLVVYALEASETVGAKRRPEERPARYQVGDVTVLTSAEYTEKKNKDKQVLQAGIDWMQKNAHPIKTTEPGKGFKDLEWIKPVLEKVKYVGIGEATHGTHEFFQFKHRMLEFLVKEMGYNTFALEASYAGCQNINEYVLNGKGDARKALASQGFWTWDTQEMLDLIEWMRTYNSTVKEEDKKLHFFGFDIQNNSIGGGVDRVKNYFNKVSPGFVQQHDTFFKWFPIAEKKQMRDSNAQKIRKNFSLVKRAMMTNRDSFILRSSRDEYETVLDYVGVISQYMGAYVSRNEEPTPQQLELRDRYMAENVRHYAQQNPEAKILIWGHNNHINKNAQAEVNGADRPMGSQLKSAFGNSYYAMGFLFGKGNFTAMDNGDTTGNMKLKQFTALDAKEGTIEWAMKKAAKGNYIVSFPTKDNGHTKEVKDAKDNKNDKKEAKEALPADVQTFTETEYNARMYGSMAAEDLVDDGYIVPLIIDKDFDALIFIENTTGAKALK
ncbi:MAG: erythromycin esterase family protein [Sphingobacteriales bacterium]|nr:MAG: erythromycin esterase family protein [Sphingobacteriales bacterium]